MDNMPQQRDPYPRCHEVHNFGKAFLLNNNYYLLPFSAQS